MGRRSPLGLLRALCSCATFGGVGTQRLSATVLAACALVGQACGAKTGLFVPDVAVDAGDGEAALDADVATMDTPAPRCIVGQFALLPRAASVVLVLDRSGSMADGINGMRAAPSNSKWQLLGDALALTLPMFQDRIDVGALLFPSTNSDRSATATCALADVPDVDVDPGPGQWMAVVQLLQATSTGGDTPTFAALNRAYDWFVRNPDRSRSDYLVLATDGGPNCNPSLDPTTCVCTSGGPGSGLMGCGAHASPLSCLDGQRTIQAIGQMASNPIASIPTFVIGIGGSADPVFAATLNAMAIAGGRPNAVTGDSSGSSFYDVEQPGDLALAFTTIQSTIARCSFVTPSRPDSPNGLTLTVGDDTIPRDVTHMNGWDWTDAAYGEITLFGPACTDALASSAAVPEVTVMCDTPDP